MNLTPEIKQKIKEHATQESPNECCGLIAFDGNTQQVYPCRNIAPNPQDDFEIETKDYIRVSRKNQILAYYHSHPQVEGDERDTKQSLLDRINSEGLKLPQVIYIEKTDDFLTYVPTGWQNPYVGRAFEWGSSDCLTLVVDYYKNELKLELGDVCQRDGKHRDVWMDRAYLKLIQESGFRIVKDGVLEKHDCILTEYIENRPPHLLIYLGAQKILHQPMDGYSRIEDFSQEMRAKIICIARHNSLWKN